jgi:hypothetical protein
LCTVQKHMIKLNIFHCALFLRPMGTDKIQHISLCTVRGPMGTDKIQHISLSTDKIQHKVELLGLSYYVLI